MYSKWIPTSALFILFTQLVASVPMNKLSANDITRIREQFMEETLSKPKYAAMRASMERKARTPPRVFDMPVNPELAKRVKELEESAKQDQKLRDMVTGPNMEEANRPIFDMLHQGDMLLNNQQMQAIERSERRVQLDDQLKDGKVFGRHRILAADPPFLAHKRNKRQILSATKYGYPKTKWSTNTSISYYFNFDIDDELKDKIREAVKFWQENSCLSFKENGTVEPTIRYFRGAGCYSSVGRQFEDFEQDISLGNGCELFGVAAHETGHALGLFHHQSRFDRDAYIDLVTANILPQWMGQFNKVDRDTATTLDISYDYGSDMHYPGYDQRSNKVMLAAKKKAYQHTLGNRRQPSFLDLKLVNEFYECPAKCPKHPSCKNGGFVNPNACTKCICPSGFAGDDCSKRAGGAFGMPENCGKDIQATSNWQILDGKSTATGKLDKAGMSLRQAECHFHIKAPAGHQIEIQVEKIKGACTNECYYGATEIKFENKQITGARLCCPSHIRDLGGVLRTTDGLAIVSAYSQKDTQEFSLRYRAVQADNHQRPEGSGEEEQKTTTGSPIDSENSVSTSSSTHVSRITEPTDQPFEQTDQSTEDSQSTASLQSTTTTQIPTEDGQSTTRKPTRRPRISTTTTQIPTKDGQSTTRKSTRRPQISTTSRKPFSQTMKNPPCRDIAINCQFQLQYCRSATAAMKVYCQKSCGFCDK